MFSNDVLGQRLRQLREESKTHKTQKEFSEFLGIGQATLSMYEKGQTKPPIDVLCNIAEKCNVSVDWLCGLSNVHQTTDNVRTFTDVFENFIGLRSKFYFSVQIIEDAISSDLHAKPPVSALEFDSVTSIFLDNWKDVLSLYSSGKIKKNLYDLWISDELAKYSFDIDDEDEFHIFMQEYFEEQDYTNKTK